jgi:cyclophilin family peptidyl-prolyl cis-trans isomerase/HEAT repeat protein
VTGIKPRVVLLVVVLSGCATAPPPAPVVQPPEEKLATILRFEDQRVLRDPAPPPAPVAPPAPRRGRAAGPPAPAPPLDLVGMLGDGSAQIRRRAALAIGRIGLADGVAPLVARLPSDPEPEVRQMCAFALGLLGRSEAATPLRAALADASPLVRGRAAEALGLINDTGAATVIGSMVAAYVKAGALSAVVADESGYPLSPEAEAARLGLYALARLKAYEPLAAAVLDAGGTPLTRWWPVAYAFRRTGDPRAIPVLRLLAAGDGVYTRAFAARGLGVLKDAGAIELLSRHAGAVAESPIIGVEAIRALGEIGEARAAPVLMKVLTTRGVHDEVRVETIRALGALRSPEAHDILLELLTDPFAPVRGEALQALARLDPERFLVTLSGLDRDRQWTVRAALAGALTELPAAAAAPLLEPMAADEDQRVLPAVLEALAKLKTPRAAQIALDKLRADDPVVRGAAAAALGELKPEGAVAALTAAAEFAERDAPYVARAAALAALAKFGRDAALPALEKALADKDWAVRLRASRLIAELDPSRDAAAAIRPAPTRLDRAAYATSQIVSPPVSTHVYIDTDKGTIQVELAVLDAPLTVRTFTDLAQSGYFGGVAIHRVVPNFVVQDGDPRGDGEGGPGYTIRDELNQRPYLRGTVGMALDWADTGGSQFFITHSPQPHLDARYTVFGQVVSGMDVVDRLARGDVIRQVRVWNGTD